LKSAISARFAATCLTTLIASCAQDSGGKRTQQASDKAPVEDSKFSDIAESEFAGAATSTRRVMTPLVHTGLLNHERQTYDYRPGFEPNPISFDRFNRPYMIRSDGKLQKMSSSGRWSTVDIPSQVRAGLLSQGLTWPESDSYNFTRQAQNTIVFDNSDNMYMLFDLSRNTMTRPGSTNNAARGLLLHSRDYGDTWTTYYLPDWTRGKGGRLEGLYSSVAPSPK
jgi:hypothetical protein